MVSHDILACTGNYQRKVKQKCNNKLLALKFHTYFYDSIFQILFGFTRQILYYYLGHLFMYCTFLYPRCASGITSLLQYGSWSILILWSALGILCSIGTIVKTTYSWNPQVLSYPYLVLCLLDTQKFTPIVGIHKYLELNSTSINNPWVRKEITRKEYYKWLQHIWQRR